MRTLSILRTGLALVAALLLGAGCSQQSKVAGHLARAATYHQEGDLEKAKIEYLNVLRLNRTNAVAVAHLGAIFFDQGAIQQAFSFLQRSRELAPLEVENRVRLGHILLSRGETTQARDEALFVLGHQPANDEAILLLTYASKTEAEINDTRRVLAGLQQQGGWRFSHHLALANFLFRNRNVPAAETEIRKALALESKSYAAHLALANLLLSQTNLAQAGPAYRSAAELSPLRHGARIRYAEFLLQNNTNSEAGLKVLGEYLAAAPDFLAAKRLMSQVALSEGRHADALRWVEEVLRLDPIHFDSQVLRGNILLASGELSKAVEVFEKVDRTFAPSAEVKYQLALTHLLNKKIPLVVPLLEQAVKLNPDSVEAVRLRGQLELRMGDVTKAASGILPLAKKRPDDISLQLLLAECYMVMGRHDDAMQVYGAVTKRHPGSLEAWMAAGQALRVQDRNADARGVFEHVRKLAPQHLGSLYQLVELELAEKQYAKASAWVAKQSEEARRSAPSQLLEGRIYIAQGDWAKAETALRAAIAADANLTASYYLLANVFTQSKQQDKAIIQLEQLIAKNPKEDRALMLLGMLQQEKREWKSAQATYERLLAINPGFVPALNNLAVLYSEEAGQLDKAYELAQKARQLVPEDPSIADTLGWILFQQRKYSEALPLLRESAARFRQNGEILFHLGMTYYMLTQEGPARSAFEAALKSPTPFKGREEIRQRLDLLNRAGSRLTEESLLELARQHPDDPFCRMGLAEFYEAQKDPEKAARAYQAVLDSNPKAIQALSRLAVLYAGPLKDQAKALDLAKRAQAQNPDDPSLAAIYGQIAFQNNEHVLAYNLLREASAALTNRADVIHQFAWAAYSVGREGEASSAMDRVLRLNPDRATSDSATWFMAMTSGYRAGTPAGVAEAAVRASELLKAAPNHVPGLMVQGAAQMAKGDRALARQTFERVQTIYPEFFPVRKPLALLYADDPALEQTAFEMARKLRELMPKDLEIASLMGRLSFRRQDYTSALLYFQEVLASRQQDYDSHYFMGLSYAKLRQPARAKDSFQRALALGLKDPYAAEAKRQIADVQGN
jgi:tetratricopeptide (TPR) repeat protein